MLTWCGWPTFFVFAPSTSFKSCLVNHEKARTEHGSNSLLRGLGHMIIPTYACPDNLDSCLIKLGTIPFSSLVHPSSPGRLAAMIEARWYGRFLCFLWLSGRRRKIMRDLAESILAESCWCSNLFKRRKDRVRDPTESILAEESKNKKLLRIVSILDKCHHHILDGK